MNMNALILHSGALAEKVTDRFNPRRRFREWDKVHIMNDRFPTDWHLVGYDEFESGIMKGFVYLYTYGGSKFVHHSKLTLVE